MTALAQMVTCPHCGAPLSVAPGRSHVICIFCNTSLLIARPPPGALPNAPGVPLAQLSAEAVPREEIERVKQLLLDGKRDEAIAHYARVAAVPTDEATRVVENLFLSAYWTLTRHMPLSAFGFVLYATLISIGAGLAVWGFSLAQSEPAYFVLVAIGALFALWQTVRFFQKLASTIAAAFGAQGRGRVLRSATVREMKKDQGYLVVVLFEVTPDDGSPAFVDQETLYLGPASLAKLVPGNVVRVRFDGARQHVFPISPVTVIASGA